MSRGADASGIVIVGAGMAGLSAARRLSDLGLRATVVDPSPWFEWLPNIHELLSGRKTPASLRLDRQALLAAMGHRLLAQRVTGIDLSAQRLHLGEQEELPYDRLLLACGGVDHDRGVEGVAGHALPFKSVDDCYAIGSRLARLMASGRPVSVVIVGGGVEGIEALGEILRCYRQHAGLHVTLLEGGPRLMGQAPAVLDEMLRERLAGQPVTIRCATRVAAVTATGVRLAAEAPAQAESVAGAQLAADMVIWTGGVRAPDWVARSPLAGADGWATVTPTLQSPASARVWVCGDVGNLPGVRGKQASDALAAGVLAASNLAASFQGQKQGRGRRRRQQSFRASPTPQLLTLGDLDDWLVTPDQVIAGPALGELKEAIYQFYMARLDRSRRWRALPGVAARLGGYGWLQWQALLTAPGGLLQPGRWMLRRRRAEGGASLHKNRYEQGHKEKT
ncbi:MAG: FAD-dependent oxidoreductase [Alcanivorax sp.]|nr:FAD-dependent oxidoreductase [Alcanivorax sp.]